MSNLDISIRRFAESDKVDYAEICNCHNPERNLRFDANLKRYYGCNGCNQEFPCARLQINKHKITLYSKSRRLLDPYFAYKKKEPIIRKTSYDQTLDKFFAE
ncbi:MAG TPA: hypothetical protein VMZ29_13535 [Candidatus Bathyarchaeia archaeon]|nr:hypothetical protein [Candidatus Bathyarchaeia archaeon]